MRRLGVVLVVLGLGACGGQEEWYTPSGPVPPEDQGPTPPAELTPAPSALQSVVRHIQLPCGADLGLDLNGDGLVDNQIGRLLGELKGLLGLDLQPTLDQQLAQGKAILLYDVRANSLFQEKNAEIRAHVGRDLDGDPTDNFSGSEPFSIRNDQMQTAVLPATITGAQLSSLSPGHGFISLPFLSRTAVLPLRRTRIRATVSSGGMQQGVLGGALALTEAIGRLTPVLAAELDRLYKQPNIGATTKQAFGVLLDSNADGSISEQELRNSNAFGFLLNAADIDTDGDGTPDALSFGLGFSSVSCSIQEL